MPQHHLDGINILPLHHMTRAGVIVLLATVFIALSILFARGVSDSPYPTPTPTNYSNVQLPTL